MIKAQIVEWHKKCYTVLMPIKDGWLETGNRRTLRGAKQVFIAMCDELGVDRNRYQFKDNIRKF